MLFKPLCTRFCLVLRVSLSQRSDYSSVDARHWYLDARHWSLDARHWYLDARHWSLDARHWYLDASHWYLDALFPPKALGRFTHPSMSSRD